MLVEEVRQGKEKRLKDLVMVSLTSAPPHSTALVFRDQKSEIEAISYGKLLSASCALEAELRKAALPNGGIDPETAARLLATIRAVRK